MTSSHAMCNIRGISVLFPYEPYDLQKDYMDKVIQCLQNNQNGVLESPTGTGKTLAILCSCLAWLSQKKVQFQEQWLTDAYRENPKSNNDSNTMRSKNSEKESGIGVPTIIYSSRTHSQLSQAMQELKKTAYSNVNATVLGGRDQLCIHPEIIKETNNSTKTTMCNLKVKSRSCQFYNRIEKIKDDPKVKNIMDIEDLVSQGKKQRFCPYYMARELHKKADIIFMPYNYLLDGRTRKAFGISLCNCIVILDEAHNIERICEDSASIQLRSADFTLCIDEVTTVMQAISTDVEGVSLSGTATEELSDFNAEELCMLKEIILKFETLFDIIEIKDFQSGTTFPGDYIFDIMDKSGINQENKGFLMSLIDKLVQFLSTVKEGPLQRRGNGLAMFLDLLELVFAGTGPEHIEKVRKCYKVHVNQENGKLNKRTTWLSKHQIEKPKERILSFWCFSAGFGMNLLMDQNLKCLILTSGTLAPLRPLVSELDLKVDVRLENPHIVKSDQVCVKVITHGPDKQPLNSSYKTREDPKYIASLGRTIQNMARMIPGGLLIFYPSYTIMNFCQTAWQISNIWASINSIKPIFVEPRDKDAFNQNMNDYYERIRNPEFGGAIFMGVCRGKVSEGLDFADANGRGVIITGLPYPPLKDPRIVLKKAYLDNCRKIDKEYLSGAEWYQLEASRAVNQAIGRVIRHRYDYGIILLLDERFSSFHIRNNMSKWLRDKIEVVDNFGKLIATTKKFFQDASKIVHPPNTEFNKPKLDSSSPSIDGKEESLCIPSTSFCSRNAGCAGSIYSTSRSVEPVEPMYQTKRRKIIIQSKLSCIEDSSADDTKDFIIMLRNVLTEEDFVKTVKAVTEYRNGNNVDNLIGCIEQIFQKKFNIRYVLQGIFPYLKVQDKEKFNLFWDKFR